MSLGFLLVTFSCTSISIICILQEVQLIQSCLSGTTAYIEQSSPFPQDGKQVFYRLLYNMISPFVTLILYAVISYVLTACLTQVTFTVYLV